MPPRDTRLRVTDILAAISRIHNYTTGMDFTAFSGDEKTIDAVVRNITIIGEAARAMPASIVSAHSEIPWQDMKDMRNFLVHAYFGLNKQILWDTIQQDLPPLVAPLEKLLSELK